jgi:uncharacterized iron-regulated membrane protein
MTAKKIVSTLHLWLGIPSGLLVFIIAFTGCLYVFQAEIQNVTQPYRKVEVRQEPTLPPSALKTIAEKTLPDKTLMNLNYRIEGKAVEAQFYGYEPDYYYSVFIDPYSGKVLHILDNNRGFFSWIIRGHAYLWLPTHIGQPIVATATLIFVILLISGIILWFPKNAKILKNSLWFRWKKKTNWNRKKYDLHNILGFYSFLIALCIALTGLVWGFQWFSNAAYKATGGQKDFYPTPELPLVSNPSNIPTDNAALDSVYSILRNEYPDAKMLSIQIPEEGASILTASANQSSVSYWKTDNRHFNRFTLKDIPIKAVYGRLKDADGADLLRRMNYDIHVGSIGGLPGKILVFFISLFVATLPVTGFLMWYKKQRKQVH